MNEDEVRQGVVTGARVALKRARTWSNERGAPVEDEDGREHCAGVIVHRLTDDDS